MAGERCFMVNTSPYEGLPFLFNDYDIYRKEPDSGTPAKNVGNAAKKAFSDFNRDVQKFGDWALPKLKVTIIIVGKTSLKLIEQAAKIAVIAAGLGVFVSIALPNSFFASITIIAGRIYGGSLFPWRCANWIRICAKRI